MKTLSKYLFLTAAIIGFAGMANAAPSLYVWGGSWLNIADGGSLDSNSAAGVVQWSGSINNFWNITLDVGTVGGTQASPELTLDFTATSLTDSSTALWLDFVNDNLGPTKNGSVITTFSGQTLSGAGTVSYWTNFTPSGSIASTLLTAGGPFSGPSFSNSVDGGAFSSAGLYTLGNIVEITNGGAGYSVTGTLLLSDPPLPVPDSGTTLLLLGVGLTGLGLVSRLRRRVI